jgi:hypothetical protein
VAGSRISQQDLQDRPETPAKGEAAGIDDAYHRPQHVDGHRPSLLSVYPATQIAKIEACRTPLNHWRRARSAKLGLGTAQAPSFACETGFVRPGSAVIEDGPTPLARRRMGGV